MRELTIDGAALERVAAYTDDETAVAGRLEAAVNASPEGLNRSSAARKARTDIHTARRILYDLSLIGRVVEAGNGAWTRYLPLSRAREGNAQR